MDVRATRQVEQLGSDEVHRLTGKPADTTPSLYKLLWLREHEPETIERTRWVVDVHAFLVNRLTGGWRTTTACADPARPDRHGAPGLVGRFARPCRAHP